MSKPFKWNFSSIMFMYLNVTFTRQKVDVTSAHNSLANSRYKNPTRLSIIALLCNGTSFNPLLCRGFKVLSVMVSRKRSKRPDLCVDRESAVRTNENGWVLFEKWLEEHFNILCLAHVILLMNTGLLPKNINLNLYPFWRQWKSNSPS